MNAPLCQRLGGESAINASVDSFYAGAFADVRVKDFFEEIDMEVPRGRQKALLVAALGGPANAAAKPFDFQPFAARLTAEQARAVAELAKKALAEAGADPAAAEEALALAERSGLLPPSAKPFDLLGGEQGVASALDALHALAGEDGQLGDAFAEIDMEVPRGRQKAALALVLGGPSSAQARPFNFSPYARKVSDEQIEALQGHLKAVLAETGGEASIPALLDLLRAARQKAWDEEKAAASAPAFASAGSGSAERPKPLFERIGGWEAVNAAVDDFYSKILNDGSINPFFQGVDMKRQRERMRWFLAMAFGGPKYSGRSMREVHRPLVQAGLNDAHFDTMTGHIRATMRTLKVPEDIIDEAMAIVETTRVDVLNKSPEDAPLASAEPGTSESKDVSMWTRIRGLWKKPTLSCPAAPFHQGKGASDNK